MTVRINKPAINLREELASLRNQGGLPKEDKLYVGELITNGTFDNGTTGWIGTSNASLTGSNGRLRVTSTAAGYEQGYQKLTLEIGKTYRVRGDLYYVSGAVGWIAAGYQGNYEQYGLINVSSTTTTKSFDITFKAVSSTFRVKAQVHNGAVGNAVEIDNVSVQEVGENLVTNGTFDTDTAGWDAFHANLSVVNNTLKVEDIVGTFGYARYEFGTVVGKTYTVEGTLVDATTGNTNANYVQIGTPSSGTAISNNNIGNSNNTDFSFTFVAIHTTTRISLASGNGVGEFGTWDNIKVYEGSHQVIQSIPHGYDVQDVYIDGELAREGEAYDYQVKTDGINQWLKPTVEPTATTETVVIGVRK